MKKFLESGYKLLITKPVLSKKTMKIKINIMLFSLLFLLVSKVPAQKVSIEGGYISAQYRNMLPYNKPKGGFLLGIGYFKPIKDSIFFFKTGLNFLQLDAKGAVTFYNQVNEEVLSYQKAQEIYYLQIPMLLQWDIPVHNKVCLSFQGGLAGNFLLRSWQNPQPRGKNHNVTSSFERIVLSYLAGAKIIYKLSPTMGLQVSYFLGSNLTSVQKQVKQSGFNYHAITIGLEGDLIQAIKKFK